MTMSSGSELSRRIGARLRDVPDFPRPGILFKDITPVLGDPSLFRDVVAHLAERFHGEVDVVAGIESRGFIIGGALAAALGTGFTPIRKPGKLPWERVRVEYQLEYGSDALELHVDAVGRGSRVLVVDDVLATGGTAAAAVELVRRLGGDVVAATFLLELAFLSGRSRLPELATSSILVL
jgi:adenine phosphoribosyltransferase